MNKFWKIFTKEIVRAHPVLESIVYDVDNFNKWFCDPQNNAEYAHSGIFLRIDKLSQSHVDDYLKKCYGISESSYEKNNALLISVREDWRKKLNGK